MSRLSGPERGEQNLAKVRSYLAGLQAAGQSLPLEDGRPNISAVAEAAGVLRNVFYTNSGGWLQNFLTNKALPKGVALILDIDSQAARTGLRSGRSVRPMAGPHRSLRARARSWTMC